MVKLSKLSPDKRTKRAKAAADKRWENYRKANPAKKMMNARMGEYIKVTQERGNKKDI